MKLFHLTHIAHLIEIENDEFLEVTESNIGAPFVVDGEHLPDLVPVILRSDSGEVDTSDPRHPDFSPVLIPAPIYMQMREDGDAPTIIPADVFAAATAPLTSIDEESGRAFIPSSVIVGWDPDRKALRENRNSHPDDFASSKFGDHVGPDVVWLTDDPTPSQGWQALEAQPDMPYMFRKNTVLITVEVPDEDVKHWPEWSQEQGILDWWYEALDMDEGQSGHWYVVPRRIPKSEWVSIHNTETGSCYWTRESGHLEGDARFSVPMPTYWVHLDLRNVV